MHDMFPFSHTKPGEREEVSPEVVEGGGGTGDAVTEREVEETGEEEESGTQCSNCRRWKESVLPSICTYICLVLAMYITHVTTSQHNKQGLA